MSLWVIEKLHARNRRSADPLMTLHMFCALFVNKDLQELSDGRAELLKDQSKLTNADVSTPALLEPAPTVYFMPNTAKQLHHHDVLKRLKKQGRAHNNNTVSRITMGGGVGVAIPGHQAIELGAEPQSALAFLIGSSLMGWCITITYGPMFLLVMGS